MADLCPCCGQGLPDSEVQWHPNERVIMGRGNCVQLTVRQAQYFDVLWKLRQSGMYVSRAILAERAYASEIDGGPECLNTISVQFNKFRKLLGDVGIHLDTRLGRTGGSRLVLSEQRAAA
jgi:hypothetical protein